MEDLFDALTSPKWWFSIVLAGIVVNILASYLKPKCDHLFSSLFTWWKDRSNKKKTEYERAIIRIKECQFQQLKQSVRINYVQNMAIILLLMSILPALLVLLIDPNILVGEPNHSYMAVGVLAFSAFTFFISYLAMTTAMQERMKLYDALDRNSNNS